MFKAHHTPDTHPSLSLRAGAFLHLSLHSVCVCVYTTRDRTKWGGGDWVLEILFFPLVIITHVLINLYRVLGLNHGFEYLVGPIALRHGPHLIL